MSFVLKNMKRFAPKNSNSNEDDVPCLEPRETTWKTNDSEDLQDTVPVMKPNDPSDSEISIDAMVLMLREMGFQKTDSAVAKEHSVVPVVISTGPWVCS